MRKAEKEDKVVSLFDEYRGLVRERKEKEKEVKALKEEEKAIEAELGVLIPEEKSVGGVYHRVWDKSSVQYGKVYERLVEELVPKTKRGKAEEIREEFTVVRKQHGFRGEK